MSVELDGAVQDLFAPAPVTLGTPQTFDLFLEVDPEGQAITARYRVGSSLPADIRTLGTITTGALPGLGRFFTSGLGVGLAATRAGQAASSLVAVFDYFRITPGRADPSLDAGAAALMIVDTGGTLVGGSTFTPGSFRVANLSSAGQRITRLRLDLRTAWLGDLVFDPLGGAGDTVGKPFTVDVDQGVGLQSDRLLGSDGAGHRVLDVTFADFAPGEGLTFSIDVDPASIRGTPAPGPGESGSVSGLELIGSTVTAFFDDGSSHTAQLYRASGSDVASFAVARAAPLPAPAIRILGVPVTPTQVQGATQTVQVIGSPGQTVGLIVIEGARHTQGLDPGAPPLGAFQANSAVAVREQFVTLDADGTVEVPIALTRTGADGGLNHVFAAGVVPPARVSPLSAITVLELQP
jgi:hypothetical protein